MEVLIFMNKEPLDHHSIDHIIESLPTLSLDKESTMKISEQICRKKKILQNRKGRFKMFHKLKKGGETFVFLAIFLIFISIPFLDPSNLFLTSSSLEPHLYGEEPIEQWEVSEMFNYHGVNYVGKPDEYGMAARITTVRDDKEIPLFQEGMAFKSTWIILKPFEELEGRTLKVVAQHQNSADPIPFFSEVITDTQEAINFKQVTGFTRMSHVCENGCVFPAGGLWKLTLLIDEVEVGTVVVDVEAQSEEAKENINRLAQQREEIVNEFAQMYHLSLDQYDYVENVQYAVGEQELFKIVSNIVFKQGIGSYHPYVYLSKDRSQGYIFEKKKDGYSILYVLIKEDGKWIIKEVKEKQGEEVKPIL